MPTPPDQNIPRIQLPPWEWYEARKNRAAGLQQPGPQQPPASQEAATPPAGPKEKVYIVPPFSFTFGYGIGPLKASLSLSLTGFSLQDRPWAQGASKVFSGVATWFDAWGLVFSGVNILAAGLQEKRAGAVVTAADTVAGGWSMVATNIADVFAGNTGLVSDGQGIDGIAYGRDSIVSDRNFALGTAANLVSFAPEPRIAALAGGAGAYISASQLDHDIEGWMGKEGGSIVFRGLDDRRAWANVAVQMVDDWFLADMSPGLESWATTQAGSTMERIGMDGAGRTVREFGESWGQLEPPQF